MANGSVIVVLPCKMIRVWNSISSGEEVKETVVEAGKANTTSENSVVYR